jgi:hypothetical protein
VPWRQVRSRHGQAHYSGSYASATTGSFILYESRLELSRLLVADFDPQDVVSMRAIDALDIPAMLGCDTVIDARGP